MLPNANLSTVSRYLIHVSRDSLIRAAICWLLVDIHCSKCLRDIYLRPNQRRALLPLLLLLRRINVVAKPKVFKSGSVGWHCISQLDTSVAGTKASRTTPEPFHFNRYIVSQCILVGCPSGWVWVTRIFQPNYLLRAPSTPLLCWPSTPLRSCVFCWHSSASSSRSMPSWGRGAR